MLAFAVLVRRLLLLSLFSAAACNTPGYGGLMVGDSIDSARRAHPDLVQVDRTQLGVEYDAAFERREGGGKTERYFFRGGTLRKIVVTGSAGTITTIGG